MSIYIRLFLSATILSALAPPHLMAQPTKDRKMLDRFQVEPNYRNSAEYLKQRAKYPPASETARRRRELVNVQASNMNELDQKLNEEIDAFLTGYKSRLTESEIEELGLDYVESKHLNKMLLSLAPLKSQRGVYRVVFDEAFYQHVRKRGQQFRLKRVGRFPKTLYAIAGIFATLLMLYGLLKVWGAKTAKNHDDYLTTGRISMV